MAHYAARKDLVDELLESGVIVPWQFRNGKRMEVAVAARLAGNDPELVGRLLPSLEDWRTPSAAIFLYYPNRRQVPVALQAFIEFLRENLRAH